MRTTLRNAAAEGLATFLFIFAIIAAVNNSGELTPLVIGFTLMVLVSATGHISGGHLNPAVSLAVFFRGALSGKDLIAYIGAQLAGGALGGLLSLTIFPPAASPVQIEVWPAFVVELFTTFVLAYVVLNVATSKDHPNNSFYGLAIGATVFVAASTVGSISGGGFNPAVALGRVLVGEFSWGAMWLYVLAPLIGASLAAVAFRVLSSSDIKGADDSTVQPVAA